MFRFEKHKLFGVYGGVIIEHTLLVVAQELNFVDSGEIRPGTRVMLRPELKASGRGNFTYVTYD